MYCEDCGGLIAAGANFCTRCGRKVQNDLTVGQSQRSDIAALGGGKSQRPLQKVLVIFVPVILLVLIVFGVMYNAFRTESVAIAFYTVQLGTYKNDGEVFQAYQHAYQKIGNVQYPLFLATDKGPGGVNLYRFYLGAFSQKAEAEEIKNALRKVSELSQLRVVPTPDDITDITQRLQEAVDVDMRSAVKNAAVAEEAFFVGHNKYTALVEDLVSEGLKLPSGMTLEIYLPDSASYVVTTRKAGGTVSYQSFDSRTGVITPAIAPYAKSGSRPDKAQGGSFYTPKLAVSPQGVDDEMKHAVKNAATAEEVFFGDNNRYTTRLDDLIARGLKPAEGVEVNIDYADATRFILSARKPGGTAPSWSFDTRTGMLTPGQWEAKAKVKAARGEIELLGTALDTFRLDVGRYPTTQEGLEALRRRPRGLERWDGPYLKKEVPLDPWGKPYVYRSPGEHGPYDLLSYGSDGAPGGAGDNRDVTSWEG